MSLAGGEKLTAWTEATPKALGQLGIKPATMRKIWEANKVEVLHASCPQKGSVPLCERLRSVGRHCLQK